MTESCSGFESNQNDSLALVETPLADVVLRLRASWIAGPAQMWGEVCPRAIDEYAGTELEKRALATLGEGFSRFSQFLAGFEYFVLQGKELGIVGEEAVLGLEYLLVHLGDNPGELIEVVQANSSLSNVSGGINPSAPEAGRK